jgi:hypothetical protein
VAESKIKITADTKQAERAIEKLESALESVNKVSAATGKALAAVAAASGAFAFAIGKTLNTVDALAKTSSQLGMSGASLQAFQRSAQLAGIGTDELNQSLRRLQSNIGDALIKGTGPANDALKRLGITVSDIADMGADEQFKAIAAELNKIPNPAERSALAMDLLGKQGPRLLAAAVEMERLRKEAEQLGLALSAVDTGAIERAGDSLTELQFIMEGALQAATAALAPYIIAIAESIKEAVLEGGNLGNVIRDRIIPAVKLATQAMAVLATYFIAAKLTAGIIAAVTALTRMYSALKIATSAAAALNAVLGKNPLIKIAGAIAGLIGAAAVISEIDDQFSELDKKAEAVLQGINDGIKEQEAGTEKVTAANGRLNDAQVKVNKSLNDSIYALEQSVTIEKEKIKNGEVSANITKMIAAEEAKLKDVKMSMSDLDKQRIANAYTALEAIKQQASLTKIIEGLDTERLGLAVADKNQREITLAIRKQELEFGRSLNAVEKESLTNAIQRTQQAREQAGIAEAIYNATRKQTELEKVNRGLSLQPKLDPQGAAATDYSKDMDGLKALLDRKIISEQQYFAQRESLTKQHNQKLRDFELTRINESLMSERKAMATTLSDKDRAIIQSVGAEQRQKAIVADRINFEKKSDLEKTQFAIDNAQQVFAALGAQNKKAFEASKALAIASAIMNTYQGATKALATYPFPFNLIAAAASIAAGMAQVSAIRSQQYQGRQLGGPVMGGQSYMVGENGPELFTPNNTGSITRNGDLGGGGPVSVEFTIVANDTQGFDALLASRKGVITQIISDAMLERGQRSAM